MISSKIIKKCFVVVLVVLESTNLKHDLIESNNNRMCGIVLYFLSLLCFELLSFLIACLNFNLMNDQFFLLFEFQLAHVPLLLFVHEI
jgi:hypothetical protein